MLRLKELFEESKNMRGPLGAVAFTVLKGLQAGGANDKTVASVRVLMEKHFATLTDDDCNALVATVFERLKHEPRNKQGKWYA